MKKLSMRRKAQKKVSGPVKKKINSKTKGSTFERKVAKKFSEWWGCDVYRTPLSGGWATQKSNGNINASGDLVAEDPTFPFCVECKKVEGWHLEALLTAEKALFFSWWNQLLGECPEGKIPLLVFSRNGMPVFFATRDIHVSEEDHRYFILNHDEEKIHIGLLDHLFEGDTDDWRTHAKDYQDWDAARRVPAHD